MKSFTMSDWKNEDDIKQELRILTDGLRKLREELRGMVEPRKPNPTRAFLHRHSWPPPASRGTDVVGSAQERKRPNGKRKSDKPDKDR